MSKAKSIQIECDRCLIRTTYYSEDTPKEIVKTWGYLQHIHGGTIKGNYDLCPNCITEFELWWKARPVRKGETK